MTADHHQRVNVFLRRGKRCAFCRQDLPMFKELLENRNEQLFNKIMNNTQHVLYIACYSTFSSITTLLRQRAHNRQLPQHTGRLTNFIMCTTDAVKLLPYKIILYAVKIV